MKFNKIVYTFACLALISCRNETSVVQTPVAQVPYVETTSYDVKVNDYVPVFDKLPSRTLENVEKFNLETPLRCEVDWETQQLISTQPFDRRDFLLERVDKGDALPDLKVENLSFENKSVDEVLRILLKNTGIQIYATDSFYKTLSQKEIGGNLTQVIDLITSLGGVYYNYDNRIKRITLKRYAKWNLHVPLSTDVILGMEDALRGADIDDIVIDWEDKIIIFQGDIVTEDKVRNIINKFAIENYLIAYDIDVLRVYPKTLDGSIKWMNILEAFNAGSIKLSQKGIIGRALVVSSNFNRDSLNEFLYPQANTVLVSSGTFIVPDRWQGRFDIGRCGREVRLETDLNILNQTQFLPSDKYVGKLDNTIVLRTSNGDIAKYTVPSRLGDNILIIGIPTQYFVEGKETIIPPNAELVVLLSPRIIKIVRPFEQNK
ncbi:MAG: hypothetical protein J6J27_05680 [Alphaproteobacteria bacterium]|jgi:hypothetical protein|nr:hypothetical protein [Alphaproteobacteria bacterium]